MPEAGPPDVRIFSAVQFMKSRATMFIAGIVFTVAACAESYVRIDDLGLRIDAPEGFVEASHYLPHTKVDTPANRFIAYFLSVRDLKQILSGGLMVKDIFFKIDLLKASVATRAKPEDLEEVAGALSKQYGRVFDRESPEVQRGLDAASKAFQQGHGPESMLSLKAVTFLGSFHKAEGILSYLILIPTKHDVGNGPFNAVLVSSLSVLSVEGRVFLVSVGKVYSSSDDISTVEKETVTFVGGVRKKYRAW